MIARLSGTLIERHPGQVVIDVGGVGYLVTVPLATSSGMGEPGCRVELHVHTHVREDALSLFGFGSRPERDLFIRLLDVGGVGPKTAVALLSGLGAPDLIEAILRRDVKRLSSVPGVGRKTAERIVLELVDRVATLLAAPPGSAGSRSDGGGLRDDLVSALVNLGYNARAASEAVEHALGAARGGDLPPFEVLLKSTLRALSR